MDGSRLVKAREADRALSLQDARAAVAERFPTADAASMELVGSGWQFDAFRTADGWLFRFPRQAWCADLFGPERQVHELVAGVLPRGIAVPRVELLGLPTATFPYRFAGHRFIEGIPADAVAPALWPRLASEIGAALSAIHAIPEDEAREAGVREPDPEEEGRRQWFERAARGARAVVGLDPVVDRGVRWLTKLRWPVHRFEGPVRFIHQDLSPEHFVVEAETSRLVGMLDWTDAALGDPARDFVTLVTFAGWPFASRVLRSYAGPVDRTFVDRLRLLARLLSMVWLVEAHARGSGVAKHVEWVGRAFSRTRPPS